MSNLGEKGWRELTGKPVPIEIVLFGGGILCLTSFSNKTIVELLGLLSVAFLLAGLFKPSGRWLRLWRIASVVWLLALFSPVDIALRPADTVSVRWVRVVYGANTSSTARRMQREGLVGNRDYVNYPGSSLLVPCRRVILLSIPTTLAIRTPLCSFLKDAPGKP